MKESKNTEVHPLEPFLPSNARLLMLGSFPPKRNRWSMDFFYPNLQNDMWRIFGIIFFDDKDYFLNGEKKRFEKERIEQFLKEKGIALSDTATEVVRLKENASDKFLEVVAPIRLSSVLNRLPQCKTIAVTGQKAMDTLLTLIEAKQPVVGGYTEFCFEGRNMRLYRMPSSSRAYPKPVMEKANVYAGMLGELELL